MDEPKHPHQSARGAPLRLAPATLRELSRLRPAIALSALAAEWAVIAATIAVCELVQQPLAYAAGVVVIGSRQHALAIIVHDAVHYRFLSSKRYNDWIADLLAGWPVFLPVDQFRTVHALHHRHLGSRFDGNRIAWHTHDADGRLTREWTYPKTLPALAWKIARRGAILTGLRWMYRGLVAPIKLPWPRRKRLVFVAYYAGVVAILASSANWPALLLYWLIPYCTWHVASQYLRLVCEHSGRIGDSFDFGSTRSTLPGFIGRSFFLPRNIGYHIEHHWYPGVPWYNLPALNRALSAEDAFLRNANLQRSILASVRQCLR